MSLNLIEIVSGIFKPAADLIDAVHTSDEERILAKSKMLESQAVVMDAVIKAQTEVLQARANIIATEAKSEHWITSAWRPITMLSFLGIVVGASFGLVDLHNLDSMPDEMWTLLQIGIGGYIGGRSVEKVTDTVMDKLMKAKSE